MQKQNREVEALYHDYDYDACTLNLGLDVMEMLVANNAPSTLHEMAARLGSPVDIVRHVVDFLAMRGYLVYTRPNTCHEKNAGLTELHVLTPAMRELARYAGPVMQTMSDDIGHSCNLSVPFDQYLVVIAQAEPMSPLCIDMPLGYKYDLGLTAPGALWSASFAPPSAVQRGATGFAEAANPVLDDVIDLSSLVESESGPVAVLTVPYLRTINSVGMTACASEMTKAAMAISGMLIHGRLVA